MSSKSAIPGGRTSLNAYGSPRPAVRGISKLLLLGLTHISHVAAAPLIEHLSQAKHDAPVEEEASLWLYLTIAAVLVLLGGAFAGLTIA